MNTLLLNADTKPMSLVPLSAIRWQDAMRYIWLDKVRVLEEYDNWTVRSPNHTINVPAVIMLKEYWRPKSRVRFNRNWVFLRDNYTCQYCNEELTPSLCTLDHVVPRSHGGKTTWHNVVTACRPCNHSKGDNAAIVPAVPAAMPDYWLLANNRNKKADWKVPHESWLNYLNV